MWHFSLNESLPHQLGGVGLIAINGRRLWKPLRHILPPGFAENLLEHFIAMALVYGTC